METINGISFEDWACACANMAAGMPEGEIIKVLGIEHPIWQETNDKWSAKLGDLMVEDMTIATKYGEYFSNPKQGKFAEVNTTAALSTTEVLSLVPDFDTYQKIFWHQSKAAEVGGDPVTVLETYGLTLQSWSAVGTHFSSYQHDLMREDQSAEALKKNYELLTETSRKWENHWESYFKQGQANLADDIQF